MVGREFGQIGIGLWDMQFCFMDGGVICVQGRLEHIDTEGRSHLHQSSDVRVVEPLVLHELLGVPVTTVDAEPYCLTLTFANGAQLRIYSDDGPYECGQIYPTNANDVMDVF